MMPHKYEFAYYILLTFDPASRHVLYIYMRVCVCVCVCVYVHDYRPFIYTI